MTATEPCRGGGASPGEPAGPDALQHHIDACVGCGLCLEACPTYQETGRETESPRGRIARLNAFLAGDLEADAATLEPLERCLGCRGCEPVCPSGVEYGRILELGRARFGAPGASRSGLRGALLGLLLNQVLPRPWLRRLALRLGRLAAALGLVRLLGPWLPAGPAVMAGLLAAPDGPPYRPAAVEPDNPPGSDRLAVLFQGCVQSDLFPEVHRATARLLQRSGYGVRHADEPGCCGALQWHQGLEDDGRRRLGATVAALDAALQRSPGARIAVNAAGCGALLKEAGELLETDAARRVATATRDWSELVDPARLAGAGSRDRPAVVWQDACHLAHTQGLRSEPRSLITTGGAAELRELDEDDAGLCCGSAGIYNILQPELGRSLRERKLDAILDVAPTPS